MFFFITFSMLKKEMRNLMGTQHESMRSYYKIQAD